MVINSRVNTSISKVSGLRCAARRPSQLPFTTNQEALEAPHEWQTCYSFDTYSSPQKRSRHYVEMPDKLCILHLDQMLLGLAGPIQFFKCIRPVGFHFATVCLQVSPSSSPCGDSKVFFFYIFNSWGGEQSLKIYLLLGICNHHFQFNPFAILNFFLIVAFSPKFTNNPTE